MEFQRPYYCLCFALFTLLAYCSEAYVFYAGGRDGWVLKPSEDYNHWAGRNRFQVNDTIVFRYKEGSNSVLVVNKEGYDKCNKSNPIKKFEDGDSVFKFDRSGPFYFISGTGDFCEKGQKLIVVVLAIRSPPPVPYVSPPPGSQPPAVSPYPAPVMPPTSPPAPAVSPYPAPKTSPSSPAPAVSPTPANVPSYPTPASAPAPVKTSPPPSPAHTPANSPKSSSPSPAPANSPTSSPSPASTPGSSPPAPPASTPSSVPGSPGTPSASPPGSSNPSSSNETSPPPPNGSSAWNVAPSSLLVYAVTIVLSAALGGILGGR